MIKLLLFLQKSQLGEESSEEKNGHKQDKHNHVFR